MSMTTKKRIAVVAPDLNEMGGVQSIVEMVVRLIETSDRYECKIISLATSASDEVSVRLRSPTSWFYGVRAEAREWRGRQITHVGCWWSELEFMRYRPRRALSALLVDCDLVQVVGGFAAWGASIPAGFPVANWAATRCLWERSTLLQAPLSLLTMWRILMTSIVDRIDVRAAARADKLMVMNHLMREFALGGLGKSDNDVIDAPPGVDTEHFVPPPASMTEELGWSYILSVGRLGDSRKNPRLLLDAFILVRNILGTDIRLVLAGATVPDVAFWEDVERAGVREWVSFHTSPSADDLCALYQEATCFALSSNEEGFGVVLVEAMACATPVVATRCGGPEGIITDGEDGFLVATGDTIALAVRLEQLIRDREKRASMGLRARQTAVKRFSEAASGNTFFKVWDELIGEANAN